MSLLDDIINVANEVRRHRYLEAQVVFLAGSFVRGEGTLYSDLDLVVVFHRLPNAYRESFYFQGYPVEVFAHDPETLNYFLIGDLRQPRSHDEAIATGTVLYDALANAYLRINGHWMAKGKSIPKKLKIANPGFGSHFCDSFQELFAKGQSTKVMALAEEILKPVGGFLFEGYQQNAPLESRRPLQTISIL